MLNSITIQPKSQADFNSCAELENSKTRKKILYKKGENLKTICNLKEIGEIERAHNISECGTFLHLQIDEQGNEKIIRSNFCRERLCAVCAWRRQLKFIATTAPVLEKIAIEKKTETSYIFVTLTVQNIRGKYVKNQITHLLKAYEKFTRRKEIKPYILGSIRSLEITYNRNSETYHPHIHALYLVSNTYFANMITTEQLSKIWKSCLNVDYMPIVDIRKIRDKNGLTDTEAARCAATLEALKYSIKMKSAHINVNTTRVIFNALKGRRLIAFTGLIAKGRKEFGYVDSIDDVNMCDEPTKGNIYTEILCTLTPNGYKVAEPVIP